MIWLLACAASDVDTRPPRPDRPAGDTAIEADADTDADADSDADGDTDTDTDTDPGPPGSGGSGGEIGASTGSVGNSSYNLYAPACAASGRVSAIFSMHGSGGDGSDMVGVWRDLADQECFVVAALDSGGAGWDFSDDVDNFSLLYDVVDAGYDVNRRYLHGYSAGAHWTYIIGISNSEYFAGLGVYAGSLTYAEQWGYWPDPGEAPIPVAIAHGTGDTTVPYSEAEHAYDELLDAGWPVTLDSYSGGSHSFELDSPAVAWAWWEAHQ
jgi:predicted esterase